MARLAGARPAEARAVAARAAVRLAGVAEQAPAVVGSGARARWQLRPRHRARARLRPCVQGAAAAAMRPLPHRGAEARVETAALAREP